MTFVCVCLSSRGGRLNYIGSPGLQKGFHATHSSTLAQVKLDLDWVQLCSTSLQSHCFNQSQMSSMWTGAHKGKTLLIKMEWLAICIAIAYKLRSKLRMRRTHLFLCWREIEICPTNYYCFEMQFDWKMLSSFSASVKVETEAQQLGMETISWIYFEILRNVRWTG